MNRKMVGTTIGQVMLIEAILMVLPVIVAVIYKEYTTIVPFLIPMALLAVFGWLLSRKSPENKTIYARESFVIVSLSWIVVSLFGALPFTLSREIPSYVDSVFEIVSGFTTTGASILTNVEVLSHSILFWRSFSHWIGGMGVLVFLLALIPNAGNRSMNIMKAESPGPSVSKLVPKTKDTAKILYLIYLGITVIEIVLLFMFGMPLFDSILHTFGTVGTGGFGVKADSIGGYNAACQWIITIFMMLSGTNFTFFYYILIKSYFKAITMEEVRWYYAIYFGAVAVITVKIMNMYDGFFTALRHAAFQVASIMTTTGYATVNYDLWPSVTKMIIVSIMILGACAGSTGGGIKVSRLIIALKNSYCELKKMLFPRSVSVVKMDGKSVEDSVIKTTLVFLTLYAFIAIVSIFLISFDGFDVTSNFTAVISALSNIGPGLSMVGPSGNFSAYSNFSKIVLTLDMLAGRLEIFPLLMLMAPANWRKAKIK
ncbi:MAG: TrkH family potassium uptake protein [Anaerofustis stercorihominis]|nr:TrkH family potassium uptake protein [Anaerofustis stercorihominis]